MASTLPFCHNAARGPCAVCSKEGLPCARCRCDYYCNREHQKQDWPRHKAGCGALELRADPLLGRRLLAAKDIPAGTVLLRDSPLLLVPNTSIPSSTVVYCAGCCATLPGQWDSCRRCAHCGFPVCGERCALSDAHRAECADFQRANFKLSWGALKREDCVLWQALAALKTLNASKVQPRIRNLQSDFAELPPAQPGEESEWAELRDKMASRRAEWRSTARWLRDEAGLHWLPEEDLITAAGRTDINAIATVVTPASITNMMQGDAGALFAGLSLLEHSCTPSASSYDEIGPGAMTGAAGKALGLDTLLASAAERGGALGGLLRDAVDALGGALGEAMGLGVGASAKSGVFGDRLVVAARDLRRGEPLSMDYLEEPLLLDTAGRRERLRCWGFLCRCARCSDPTELGLRTGQACCTHCRDTPHFVVASAGAWRCERCGRPANGPALQEKMALDALHDDPRAGPREYEKFIARNLWPRGCLHPTHSLVLGAKFNVVSCVQPDTDLPEEVLKRWTAMCRELLRALDTAGRGICTRRLNVLTPLAFMAKMSLRKDMLHVMASDVRLAALGPRGSMRQFAPRVQELRHIVTQMKTMVSPVERKIFRKMFEELLELLLVMTGCEAPSPTQIADYLQELNQ